MYARTSVPFFWNQKIGLSKHTHTAILYAPPPPAAVEVVVDQLGKWRLKRSECVHLVVVPRLMTGRWRRALKRGTDFYIHVDWEEIWPLKEMYEPLLIFVVLPYIGNALNLAQRALLLETFKRRLLQRDMSEISAGGRRTFLRKLFIRARRLSAMP
jgi:hypothetical protein